ncbi:Os02g0616232 [Oryza sativa Japonica Group]|uniref:Os02g0616232 protein n=2 Tax=Oryza sativa subsp. japonica TaxID=39947 RepID=Q6K8T9_ORYSJ|nr:hypothetical protein [Oryza sativa Japonica Group]BAS79776.1 Os02g0616232 [Oryza sativa Japonica Group]
MVPRLSCPRRRHNAPLLPPPYAPTPSSASTPTPLLPYALVRLRLLFHLEAAVDELSHPPSAAARRCSPSYLATPSVSPSASTSALAAAATTTSSKRRSAPRPSPS